MIFYLSSKTVVGVNYAENVFGYPVGDGWYRMGYTTTFADSPGGGVYPMLYDNSVVEVSHPQIEMKDYVTPFVDGTRGQSYSTGGGWLDLSRHNNHGEIYGATFDSRNLGSIAFNKIDGSNNYIPLGMSDLSLEKSTITFWVNFDTITGETGNAALIFGSGYWQNNHFSITQHMTNYAIMFTVGENNYAFLGEYGGTAPAFSETGKWYHFAFSYDSTQAAWADALKVYRNGQLQTLVYGGTPQTLMATSSIYMGLSNWRGRLNRVSMHNRNLTSTEIIQIYDATKSRFGSV